MRLAKLLAGWVAILMAASVTTALAQVSPRHPPASHLAVAADVQAVAEAATTPPPPTVAAQAPASGVPGRTGTQRPPARPGRPAPPPTTARPAAPPTTAPPSTTISLPSPAGGSLPVVASLSGLHSADAVVLLRNPLSASQSSALRHVPGVTAVEVVDTGTVILAGAQAVTFGVDPGSFREFTPKSSATASRLWQYLAAGSLVSSYEMATERDLKLGSEEPISSAGSGSPAFRGWMGAFASVGLPGVDLLVDRAYSSELGLTPDTGLVVSAPAVEGATLQTELDRAVPGAAVELLRADQVPRVVPGNGLNGEQRSEVIAAALSRVGTPYVWGGAAPGGFDCSGLVQWSFGRSGIMMPRTAAEQFLTGDHIPLSDASAGDLLFWTYDPNDPGFVDHTAIYLGNGMMVVAPHTGLDVEVVPVPTADFAGAVQVVPPSR